MCGRYYRRSDKQRIGDAFNIRDFPSSLVISEDYNVAPTTFQPVIRNGKELKILRESDLLAKLAK